MAIVIGCWAMAAETARADPPRVRLASDGVNEHPVVVAADASERVRAAAAELAQQLERITDAGFTVETGDGATGLAVGEVGDFPGLELGAILDPADPTRTEAYLLRSHDKGIWLIGASAAAVEHAVWDLLHRLGHRQFFPGEAWEVVPRIAEPRVSVDVLEQPDYWARNLYSHTSRSPDPFSDRERYAQWQRRNRLGEGFSVRSGHAYGGIIRANQAAFDANPEFYAEVDGERRWRGASTKLCLANAELRALVVDHAVEVMEANPDRRSISMDPSDGGNWCECDACAAMGSVSDRVVTLANKIATAINDLGLGAKYVGIYAYNHHTAPPAIEVHPRVVVSVAAGHLTGGWRPEELFAAWGERGGAGFFGVFEYYNNIISRSLPHGQRVSNLNYLARTIPDFHRRGARMLVSGTHHGNGAIGLGAYVASRLLWDVDEADRVHEIYDDFLEKAFGPAREPMDAFYRLVYRIDEHDRRQAVTEDLVGRMYRALGQALERAADDDTRRRLRDLVLYTRYVELFKDFNVAHGDEAKLEAYGEVMRHAYRMRETMMVNVYGLFAYPRNVEFPDHARWNVPEDENPWKDARAIDDEQAWAYLEAGIANNEVGDYEIRTFSDGLVPAAARLGFAEQSPDRHGFGLPPQGRQVFYTWVAEAPAEIRLEITGGGMWPDRAGDITVTTFSDLAIDDDLDFVVARETLPPGADEHLVALPTPHEGLHRIEVDGGVGAAHVLPGADDMTFTRYSGPSRRMNTRHWISVYFYVPRGTETISFHTPHPIGDIRDGDGNAVFRFWRDFHTASEREDITTNTRSGGYFTCEVPQGQDGRVWKLEGVRGPWQLLNVPPYVARQPSELMLPREVVERDEPRAEPRD